MRDRARRPVWHLLVRPVRRALRMLCLLPTPLVADPAIIAARYETPTTRYVHAVLGDGIEHATLVVSLSDGEARSFKLPADLVFEDTAPRLADLDLDGAPEVIVVESSQMQGARLAVYDARGRVTATPFIGKRFRWLAPVGAADLDGDGRIEVAYIDRPHLTKILRIWRYEDRSLVAVAAAPGFTNHRIGERDIAGGIRRCNGGVSEMILASGDWSELRAVRFERGAVGTRSLGPDTSRAGFAQAMNCAR